MHENNRNFCANYLIGFQVNWMKFGMQLRLVCLMNLMLIASHTTDIQGRDSYLCGFIQTILMLVCIQIFTD